MKKAERDIKEEVLLVLQEFYPRGRFFVRPIIKKKIDKDRFISCGVTGQADIYGFISGITLMPIPVEIEVKRPGEKLRPAQLRWKKLCDRLGVPHLVAYSKEGVGKKIFEKIVETVNKQNVRFKKNTPSPNLKSSGSNRINRAD